MYLYIKINAFNAFNFFQNCIIKGWDSNAKEITVCMIAAHDTEGQPFSGNELGGGGGVYKAENYKNGWNLGEKSV